MTAPDPQAPPPGYAEPGVPVSPFTVTQPVAWSDLDGYQHVNHARYLTYFENARFRYFEVVGLAALYEAERIGPILARCEIDYLAPVAFPDELLVKTVVPELGRTSFSLEAEIWSRRQGRPVARGRFVIVVVNYAEGGHKVPIPELLRAAIVALEPEVTERTK